MNDDKTEFLITAQNIMLKILVQGSSVTSEKESVNQLYIITQYYTTCFYALKTGIKRLFKQLPCRK